MEITTTRHGSRAFATAVVASLLLAAAAAPAPAQDRSEPPPERPKGWLGVFLGDLAVGEGEGESHTLSGVTILGVVSGSPADEAGLRARDRILELDGEPIDGSSDLIARLGATEPGRWVLLTIERKGRTRVIEVRLDERPARTERVRMRRGWIGADVIDLPETLREHFGAPPDAGVMISWIEPGSPAEAAGLILGDVVVAIESEPVDSARAFREMVIRGGVGNELEIDAVRNLAESTFEVLVVEEPPEDELADRPRPDR